MRRIAVVLTIGLAGLWLTPVASAGVPVTPADSLTVWEYMSLFPGPGVVVPLGPQGACLVGVQATTPPCQPIDGVYATAGVDLCQGVTPEELDTGAGLGPGIQVALC